MVGEDLPLSDCDAALDVLTHRGPDDRGVLSADGVWLGLRRLSIIDVQGGHQPMVDGATGVAIVHNGEIYNYLELRRELEARGHAFVTRSDTEVLLRSYLEWGTNCLQRLNGMWGFVVWDPRDRSAFFSRDRFGVKPLYYAVRPGCFLIASEPKALVRVCPELGEVDESTIHDLLGERLVYHDERTFYRHIKSLAAGHWGLYRSGDRVPHFERFWQTPAPASSGVWDEPDAVQRFAALLDDSVALRLRSDVPVGLTLSGGIDSTTILEAMTRIRGRHGDGVTSYTAVYGGGDDRVAPDERRWARIAASTYDNVTLTEVNAPGEAWIDVLEKIVWHMDGPGFSPAVFPMWMIMQQARADGVPVLLEGQGADEVFGGYAHYAALAFVDRVRELPTSRGAGRAAMGALKAGRRTSSGRAFARDLAVALTPPLRAWDLRRSTLRTALANDVFGDATNGARRSGGALGGRFEQRLSHDFSQRMLPGFLQYGDAISMAHSIETRLPFLDYRLVEFGLALPPAARISAGETKHLLRCHLRRVGQDAIANRWRKRGYPTPAAAWLAENNGALLREVLLDPGARVRHMLAPARLNELIDRHVAGGLATSDVLYGALTTELWWQQVSRPAQLEPVRTSS